MSVNFLKLGGSTGTKAIMRHCCTDERQKHKHSNQDIDTTKTKNNISYGAGGSYEELCAAYDLRIAELDATTNNNKRKDRQTCFSLCIPRPELLPPGDLLAWANDVYDILVEEHGQENVLGGQLHVDEIHEYLDHGTWKVSREHLHIFEVPEIEGKLNGKAFSSKKAMQRINKLIDEMTREKYHVPFLTGEHARGQTVERLKQQSALEEIERSRDIIYDMQDKIGSLEADKRLLEMEIEELENQRTLLQAAVDKLLELLKKLQEQYEKLKKRFKRKQKDLEKEEDDITI